MAERQDFLKLFDLQTPYYGRLQHQHPYVKVALITKEDVLEMYKLVMEFTLSCVVVTPVGGECVVVPSTYYWFYFLEGFHSLVDSLTKKSSKTSIPPSVSTSELAQRIKVECTCMTESPIRLRQLLGEGSDDYMYVESIDADSAIISKLQSDIATICSLMAHHDDHIKSHGSATSHVSYCRGSPFMAIHFRKLLMNNNS